MTALEIVDEITSIGQLLIIQLDKFDNITSRTETYPDIGDDGFKIEIIYDANQLNKAKRSMSNSVSKISALVSQLDAMVKGK